MVLSYVAFRTPAVQTYITQKIAGYFADKWKTEVSIGGVDIDFFTTVILENLYIEDLHGDTLIYSEFIKVDIGEFGGEEKSLRLSKVTLERTHFNLVKYEGEDFMNIKFLTDAFSSDDTSSGNWKISIDKIHLFNSHFRWQNRNRRWMRKGINFQDLDVRKINGDIHNMSVVNDTIYASILLLSCSEKSGFHLRKLNAHVKVSSTGMDMESLQIQTRSSTINGALSFRYSGYRDYLDFTDSVMITSVFDKSEISVADVAYFAPVLKGIAYNIELDGEVYGRISRLKGKNITLKFGRSSKLVGDFSLTGLPKVRETFIHFKVKELKTYAADLRTVPIPPFELGKRLKVPEVFEKMGSIRFHGDFTGFYNDFVAYGDFHTSIGLISSDLSLKQDTTTGKVIYAGNLKSPGINAGTFLQLDDFGMAAFNISINGSGMRKENVTAKLRGVVSQLSIRDYNYKNIELEGIMANRLFEGSLKVTDENIDLEFDGNINFSTNPPVFNFNSTISRANLYALNFVEKETTADFSVEMVSNFEGSNLDNMLGSLEFHNIRYRHGNGDEIREDDFGNIKLIASRVPGEKSLQLFADFAQAELVGKFKVAQLPQSIKSVVGELFPAAEFERKGQGGKSLVAQDFHYAVSIKQESSIFSVFVPGLSISKNSMLHGNYSSSSNSITLWGTFPAISMGENKITNLDIELVMPADTLYKSAESKTKPLNLIFRGSCDKFTFSDSVWMLEPELSVRASNDSVNFSFLWDNKSQPAYKGEVAGYLKLHEAENKGGLGFELGIDESEIVITDSIWTIEAGNMFLFDSSSIDIENFVFRSGTRTVKVSGGSSKSKPGSIDVEMSNFDLRMINPFMSSAKLSWSGSLSGIVKFSDVFINPYVTGDLNIEELQLNERDLGDASIRSYWNNSQKKINIHGTVRSGKLNTILLDGNYYLNTELVNRTDALDFDINLNRFRVSVFEPFIKNIFSDISDQGAASGKLKLTGSLKEPNLIGSLDVSKVGVTVDFLNTQYNFADKVVFTKEWIGFDDVIINDLKGNRAMAKGRIYHDHLRNFRFDIEVKPENLYTLNTDQIQNKLYYGKAYTTGNFTVTGTPKQIVLNLALTTERGTQFFIPLNTDAEISMGGFITFINPADTISRGAYNKINQKFEKLPELNFDLEVTREAEIQLIFDETVGDILKAKGNGNLKLQVNYAGEFKIYGEYVIEEGDYLFTLQNVINKRFKIEKGGTIQWSGNPYSATVDIVAVYGLTASLYDLTLEQDDRRRVPVNCILKMSGNLMNPEIAFDIEFPNLGDGADADNLLAATTEQQLNRQMFSLLVLGQFQPLKGGGLETSGGVGANTSELLSNQLSNWLSQISEDFDIGVNYRPGDELTSKEVEVALSTQLFDERLSINGSVANNLNEDNQNSSNIVGDFTLDYKITKDGRLKIKAYNRSNDTYLTTDNAPYTQGIGLSYSKEFNTLKDLFRRKNKKQKMKSESPDNN